MISLTALLASILILSLTMSTSTYAQIMKTDHEGSGSSSSNNNSPLKVGILDPSPILLNTDGTMKNDTSLASNVNVSRIGTVADGVSKLLLVVDYNKTLQFTIKNTEPDKTTNGTLTSL